MQPRSSRLSREPDDPAVLTAQLLLRIGFGVLAVAVPVTAAFSRRALFVLLPFGAGLILIAAALTRPPHGGRKLSAAFLSPVGIAALFLALWAGLSLAWTPFPADAAARLLKLASTLLLVTAVVAVLPERMRLSSIYLLPIGVAIAAVMTFVIALNGGPHLSGATESESFTLERAAIALAILIWPALGGLATRNRWSSAGALAVAVAAAALAARAPVALLALAGGALAFAGAKAHARRTAAGLAWVSAALFLAAPLLPFGIRAVAHAVSGGLPEWMRPVAVWADIVRSHKARLITGHGLEAVLRSVAAGYLPAETPKSILFEIWYELGAVGAVAMAIIVARAFWVAGRAGAGVSAFLIAALASALTLALLDQNPSQLWWVTLLAIAVVCFAAVINGQYRTTRPVARPVIEAPPQHSAS